MLLHVSVARVWTLCLCDVDHACSVVFFTSLCGVVDVVPAEPFAGGLCGFPVAAAISEAVAQSGSFGALGCVG